MNAFFNAWRTMIALGTRPFARAVWMYSWRSTSSIDERVIRITIAISASERATTGIAICCRLAHGSTHGGANSSCGCQWNTTPVISSNIAASQKFGTDRPTMAIRRTTKSVGRVLLDSGYHAEWHRYHRREQH